MATAAPEELAHYGAEEEEEEEDPEEVEPWLGSSDSEPEEHPALEPCVPIPSPEAEPEQHPPLLPAPTNSASTEEEEEGEFRPRWPGFPGASVFRLVVGGDKVGGLIGRRGETIRRLCEETRARVRVLDPTDGVPGQIVLISATEETQAELAPAMDAAIKIFKHVNEIEGINTSVTLSASAPEICSARLLLPKGQAAHLIGKQGIMIKSIQETTGGTIRIIDQDDLLNCGMVDERIVEIFGAPLKALNALKSVLGFLRKFLVDHSVLHLFERKNQAIAHAQDSSKEDQVSNEYVLPVSRGLLLSDGQSPLNLKGNRYLSYGRDPSVCDQFASEIRHQTESLIKKVTVTQTMKIPLLQADEIIGVRGQNIAHIRSVSGAIVVLEETGDYMNEVLVTIQGSSSQVHTAHQLVQVILLGDREPPPTRSSYSSDLDTGLPRRPFAPDCVPASPDHPLLHHEHRSYSDRWGHSAYRGYRLV